LFGLFSVHRVWLLFGALDSHFTWSHFPEQVTQLLWKSKSTDNYKNKVRGFEPLSCIYDIIITVQNGQLAKVEENTSLSFINENPQYAIVEKENWNNQESSFGCNYEKFTIPQVFTNVNGILKDTNPLTERPEIVFDSEVGYVTYYGVNYHGYGLFTFVLVTDCCSWYEFSAYEPLH